MSFSQIPKKIKIFFSAPYSCIVVESETDNLEDAEQFFIDISSLLARDGQIITTATAKTYPIILNVLSQRGLILYKNVNNYYFSFMNR